MKALYYSAPFFKWFPFPAMIFAFSVLAPDLKSAQAQTTGSQVSTADAPSSLWKKIRPKIKASLFTEVMTPAIDSSSATVPDPSGAPFDPVNAFNLFQTAYAFSPRMSAFYLQRLPLNLNSLDAPQRSDLDLTFTDPRFGIRLTIPKDKGNWSRTLDLYTQPGLSEGSQRNGRQFDVGAQGNISYSTTNGKWTFGSLGEYRRNFFRSSATGIADFQGFVAPYINYNITEKLSTQSWGSFAYRHERGTDLNNVQWSGQGLPYVQNGLGYQATEKIWVAGLVNNFIGTAPTLQNTWFSLWISTTLL
jgi:hypothetical protein